MKSKIFHAESGNDAGLLQKDAEQNAVLLLQNGVLLFSDFDAISFSLLFGASLS